MNDNESNVIDLMAGQRNSLAIVVPDGLHDIVVLGFMPDGSLYFNSEADQLERISMLLLLAQQRLAKYHAGEVDKD